MQGGKALIIFFVDPLFLTHQSVLLGLLFDQLIVPFEQILSEVVVDVVGSRVEEGAVLSVEDCLELGDDILYELFGCFVVRWLDGLENCVEAFLVGHFGIEFLGNLLLVYICLLLFVCVGSNLERFDSNEEII